MSQREFEILLGIILFIYGFLKLFIGITIFTIPAKYREKANNIPLIKELINEDDTISGKVYSFFIGIFGLYTLLHSFSQFGVLNKNIE